MLPASYISYFAPEILLTVWAMVAACWRRPSSSFRRAQSRPSRWAALSCTALVTLFIDHHAHHLLGRHVQVGRRGQVLPPLLPRRRRARHLDGRRSAGAGAARRRRIRHPAALHHRRPDAPRLGQRFHAALRRAGARHHLLLHPRRLPAAQRRRARSRRQIPHPRRALLGVPRHGRRLHLRPHRHTRFDLIWKHYHHHQATCSPGVGFGLLLVLTGIGFKIAMVPFHSWAPDVYEGAPNSITAFLSVGSKAGGLIILMRVVLGVFDNPAASAVWVPVLTVGAIASLLLGNLAAIPQRNLKRMLGYSSIGHTGFMLVAIIGASATLTRESHSLQYRHRHRPGRRHRLSRQLSPRHLRRVHRPRRARTPPARPRNPSPRRTLPTLPAPRRHLRPVARLHGRRAAA